MVFFGLCSQKAIFLLCACTIPKGAVVSLSNFIYDVNMLVLKLKNVYFKERLQFITTLNLLLCLSVHYKDTTMILEEELKLAFRPWIQKYCPVTTVGQLLHFYGLCSLTDVISVPIYSLLSRKFKWHSRNNQDTELLMSLHSGYWLNLLLSFLYCQMPFFAWWIQTQNGMEVYLVNVALQFWSTETVLWRRPFRLTCFSVNLALFPPAPFPVAVHYIWANYIWTTERLVASPVQASCLGPNWL